MGQHPASVGFGHYLREVIHAAGFATPTQFARKVGNDPSVVLRWISEEQRPTIRSIERIAPVLGRTIHEMVNAAYPDSLGPVNQVPGHQSRAGAMAPAERDAPPAGASAGAKPHRLAAEVDQLLGPDSPLGPADRDNLQATLDRELGRYRRLASARRTA